MATVQSEFPQELTLDSVAEFQGSFSDSDLEVAQWAMDQGLVEEIEAQMSNTEPIQPRAGLDPCSAGVRGAYFATFGAGVILCAVGCALSGGFACIACGLLAIDGVIDLAIQDHDCSPGGGSPEPACPDPWWPGNGEYCPPPTHARDTCCCMDLPAPADPPWECDLFRDGERQ